MSSNKVSIDSIIDSYNRALEGNTGNVELEAKVHDITSERFLESLEGMSKVSDLVGIETTINNITNKIDNSGSSYSFIESMQYDNNQKFGTLYGTKKSIGLKFHSTNDFMKYALSLSQENVADKSQLGNNFNSITRFKVRLSFSLSSLPAWRYDYTLTSTLHSNELSSGIIKEKRELMFAGISSGMTYAEVKDKILKIASSAGIHFEIEVEKIDKKKIESKKEVESAMNALWKSMDSSFKEDDPRMMLIRNIYESISDNPIQKKLTLKNILNAARSLTKSDYYQNVYPPLGYYVTDKADGERAVLFLDGLVCNIVSTNLQSFPVPESLGLQKTIVDCELIKTKSGKVLLGIFDVMLFNGESVVSKTLEDRIIHGPRVVSMLKDILAGQGITLFMKEYTQINQPIEESILKVSNIRRDYKTDGLIITSQTGSYYETKNYKWKPTEENTIDFMIIDCPEIFLGHKNIIQRDDKKLYCLLSGMNSIRRKQMNVQTWSSYQKDTNVDPISPYIPVLFQSTLWPYSYLFYGPKDSSLDGKIGEFVVNPDAANAIKNAFSSTKISTSVDIWSLVRIREDRNVLAGEYGNDYDIAESIFSSIIDPFELKDLWIGLGGYFEKSRDEIYKAPNKFKRFVIKKAFEKYIKENDTILDIAAGRGADLGLYFERRISRLVALDIDPMALVELIRRSADSGLNALRGKSRTGTRVSTLVTDCGDNPAVNYNAIVERFGVSSADVIICNFAFHYLCQNVKTCQNVLSLLRDMSSTSKDTYFIMTVMDGKKIFELLKDKKEGQSWTVTQDGIEKYLIRKDYDDDKLESFGQKISVKLPMTTKLYQEPLCNLDAVIKEAEYFGFHVISQESFGTFGPMYMTENPKMYSLLSKDDMDYCALHSLIVFRRLAKKTGSYEKKYIRNDLRNDFI